MVTVPQIEYQYPPEVFLKDCGTPIWTGMNYEDLVIYAVDLAASIRLCNIDKVQLREWREKSHG